jgi:hypothetical protein
LTLDAPVVAPDNLLPYMAIGMNIQRERRKAHQTSWGTQHSKATATGGSRQYLSAESRHHQDFHRREHFRILALEGN